MKPPNTLISKQLQNKIRALKIVQNYILKKAQCRLKYSIGTFSLILYLNPCQTTQTQFFSKCSVYCETQCQSHVESGQWGQEVQKVNCLCTHAIYDIENSRTGHRSHISSKVQFIANFMTHCPPNIWPCYTSEVFHYSLLSATKQPLHKSGQILHYAEMSIKMTTITEGETQR